MTLQELLDYGFVITFEEETVVREKVGKGEPIYDALMIELANYNHSWMDTNEIMDFQDKNNLPIEYYDTIPTAYTPSWKSRVRYYNRGTLWSGSTLTKINLFKDKRGKLYILSKGDVTIEVDVCDGDTKINNAWEKYWYRGGYSSHRELSSYDTVKELMDDILDQHKRERRETMNEYNKKIRDLKQEYKKELGRMNSFIKNMEAGNND